MQDSYLEVQPVGCSYKIVATRGLVPKVLDGLYTGRTKALAAIQQYIHAKERAAENTRRTYKTKQAKAMAAERKAKEAAKKEEAAVKETVKKEQPEAPEEKAEES
jgi:hypothetical protein